MRLNGPGAGWARDAGTGRAADTGQVRAGHEPGAGRARAGRGPPSTGRARAARAGRRRGSGLQGPRSVALTGNEMNRDPVDVAGPWIAALGDGEPPRDAAERDPASEGPALPIDEVHQFERVAGQVEECLGGRQSKAPWAEQLPERGVAVDDHVPGAVQHRRRALDGRS